MAKNIKTKAVVAKSDDGNIQITFTVPFDVVKDEREKALKHLSEKVKVPGFRNGKAPLDKVMENLKQQELLEHTLSHILPELLSEAIKQNNIKPILYPKYELIKTEEGSDWEIRATTCEAPKVKLGDYKQSLSKLSNGGKSGIWTPEKGSEGKKSQDKELSHDEKEQLVLKLLLENIKVKIPMILIDEEVNNRLSNLLSRIEKLGLSLDSYLASLGKNPEKLRGEYKTQSEEGLALDFILNEVAIQEKITVDKSQVDESLKAAAQDPNLNENIDTPERRRFLEAILKRRKALDFLISLT